MAVTIPVGGPKQAPQNDARQPPQNEPKKPGENAVAKQSPYETKSAINTTFGQVPNKDKAPADSKAAPALPGSPVTGSDGNPLRTPDGRNVVVGDNKMPIPVESDGRPMTDPRGNIYAVDEAGKYLETVDGKYGVYEKTSGNRVAADPITGEPFKDPGGNPYFIDKNAAYIQTPDGKYLVYDTLGNTVAADQDGKIVTDENGNAYVVQPDGNYAKAEGKYVVYDKAGNQVVKTGQQAPIPAENFGFKEFVDIYRKVDTKELELTTRSGFILKVDPATNALAKDVNDLPVILHDPVDDPDRPPVKPTEDPQTTIDNLPQGKERGDPMEIKKELFTNGYLDTDRVYKALAKYNVLDVFDAFVKSSKDGGNKTPVLPKGRSGTIIQPNEEQARHIIGTLIAWANMNGHYAPMKENDLPRVILYDNGDPVDPTDGFVIGSDSGAVWVCGPSKSLPSTLAHELNHESADPVFKRALDIENGKNLSQLNEAVTEYISTKWTGNHADTPREDPNAPVNEVKEIQNVDTAVRTLGMELGGGDVNKGMDILQRAYFAGDPVAIELFMRAYKRVAGTA